MCLVLFIFVPVYQYTKRIENRLYWFIEHANVCVSFWLQIVYTDEVTTTSNVCVFSIDKNFCLFLQSAKRTAVEIYSYRVCSISKLTLAP